MSEKDSTGRDLPFSSYVPGKKIQAIADEWAAELREQARSGATRVEHLGTAKLTAHRFTLGVGGPGADLTFVVDGDGDIDYAVLDYIEPDGRAQHVLTGHYLTSLFTALREYGE